DQVDFIVRWTLPDGIRTFVNRSYCEYYGVSEVDVLRSSIFDLAPPEKREENRNRILESIAALTPDNPVVSGQY
ncbi:MAG TPA: PAS domain-containing protein, partial [Aggregatilineales bacterium]|nr:PAS domain-containing protein [Aggregatilineales bacterium]